MVLSGAGNKGTGGEVTLQRVNGDTAAIVLSGVADLTTVQIDTGSASADINFNAPVDNGGAAGPIDLTLTSAQDIFFNQAVGSTAAIGDVLIEADGGFATNNLTVADGMVFNAESFLRRARWWHHHLRWPDHLG